MIRRNRFALPGVGIVLLLAALLAAALPRAAGTEGRAAMPAQAAKLQVGIAVQLLEVGRLDTATGSYTMDFYLALQCAQECDPSTFEIRNGEIDDVALNVDEPSRKIYRVQATLAENIDHRKYPFDSHELTIVLEDRSRTVEEQVYVVDAAQTGVDRDVVMAGWELTGGWEAAVDERVNPLTGETYSRYTFQIEVRRPRLAAVLKGLVPAYFIVAVAFLGFALVRDRLPQRLSLQATALTAAFLFHLAFTSSIPPTGHLTFADTFMIVNYVALVLGLVVTVAMLVLTDREASERAARLDRYSLVVIPVLWLLLQGVTWALTF